jgi:Tol biopolymer transport system component
VVVRVAPPSEAIVDLSVSGDATPSPAFVGERLTVSLTVVNSGPSAAPNVEFETQLGGATFISGAASQGAPCVADSGLVTCPLGSVASGGSASITLIIESPAWAGDHWLSTLVRSTGTDTDPDDNSSWIVTEIQEVPIVFTDDQTGTVQRMDPSGGSGIALTTTTGGKSDAVVSPDHRTVAYWRQNPQNNFASEIWMIDIDGSNERFVADVGQSMVPRGSWSPDSETFVFSVFTGGKWKAMVAHADGDPAPYLLIPDTTYGENAPAYSHDGTSIIFRDSCQRPEPARCRYHLVNADGSGSPTAFTSYPYGNGGVVWSPDGAWFYFASGSVIYRARVDGTLYEPVVSDAYGGTYWSLSPSGDRIAYTAYVSNQPATAIVDVDGSDRRVLTTRFNAADPAGCYSPVWTRDQAALVMHCYAGPGPIAIYQVSALEAEPVAPTPLGGAFRSRNPELAGLRPTA